MKKIFKALIILMVVVISGCFYDGDNVLVKSNPPKKQLTLYTIQGDSSVNQVIADSVYRFEKDNKSFKVINELIPNDLYKNRLSVCVATNQMPDVFPTWSGGILKQYISIGGVVNLDKYMKNDNYSSRFNDKALNMVTDENGIWGVPVENMSIALVFYNKDIFNALKLSEPKTFDELKNIIVKLKQRNYIPFALANRTAWTGSMFYMYFVDRVGGPSVFDNAANRKNNGSFDDDVFVQAGKMVHELVNMGAFPKGFNWMDEDAGDSRNLLYNNSAGMLLAGSWFVSNVMYEKPDFAEKIGVFPFPSISGGKGDPRNTIGTLGDNFYSVASSCGYPDKAFELIKYLIDDTAEKKRIDAGKIPPVKDPDVENPLIKEILGYINQSPNVQFWYDQYLPPKLSEAHLMLSRSIFGGEDPKKAAEEMEKITKQYYNQ
ncbi:extracellular solute-binding protein [Ruminiclostridium cellulolyticum]|uniref:Extracellular solute-binding protein family 1 n=1 Tax=Ruminiclostridium cellulolyticum (strain ATCC 35319 / DSM 5812 / JCM 6584 / H10) TaxID=394503 RepID=B8HZZ3_RUMCH|nr:extracellular solute-binding protein [Ruminiclostridium cellulolyticum]ACL75493.1 extracellular solute-binding protein family 1 [Ruminiclostridium cellulolyticum H10]